MSVQLMYDAVLFVVAHKPASLDRVTTNEHSRHTLTGRHHYLDQLYDWLKLLFNKRESLTEAERFAHQSEFNRIMDICLTLLGVLHTRLNQ